MGWDAYTVPRPTGANKKAFTEAATAVDEKGWGRDIGLDIGWLDTRLAGEYLGEATGEDVYAEEPWSPERVRQINAGARWPEPGSVPSCELWAYWSARTFLQTSAELGLGIRFSY
jgi:hypothetical protein